MKRLLLMAALCAALATPARATLTTTTSVAQYTSNGVQTSFSFPYRFLDNSYFVVTKTVASVTTALVQGTDWSMTGAGLSAGGTLTLTVAIPNGGTLKIMRSTPLTQTCNFRTTPVAGPAVESCLDRLMMVIQEKNDGTFTQLVATPITTAQASTAAPIAVPNSGNTNSAGSSASFAAADHVHQCATPTATQKGCITTQPLLIANSTAGATLTSGATTVVVYGTVETDTDSAYNAGTGVFTVPTNKGGHYQVSASIQFNGALTATDVEIDIFVAGSVKRVVRTANPASNNTLSISATFNVSAGQTIDVRAFQNSGGSVSYQTAASAMYLTIKQVPN